MAYDPAGILRIILICASLRASLFDWLYKNLILSTAKVPLEIPAGAKNTEAALSVYAIAAAAYPDGGTNNDISLYRSYISTSGQYNAAYEEFRFKVTLR
jgi:hypothetical protein